jgi:hypothetical protein
MSVQPVNTIRGPDTYSSRNKVRETINENIYMSMIMKIEMLGFITFYAIDFWILPKSNVTTPDLGYGKG